MAVALIVLSLSMRVRHPSRPMRIDHCRSGRRRERIAVDDRIRVHGQLLDLDPVLVHADGRDVPEERELAATRGDVVA